MLQAKMGCYSAHLLGAYDRHRFMPRKMCASSYPSAIDNVCSDREFSGHIFCVMSHWFHLPLQRCPNKSYVNFLMGVLAGRPQLEWNVDNELASFQVSPGWKVRYLTAGKNVLLKSGQCKENICLQVWYISTGGNYFIEKSLKFTKVAVAWLKTTNNGPCFLLALYKNLPWRRYLSYSD